MKKIILFIWLWASVVTLKAQSWMTITHNSKDVNSIPFQKVRIKLGEKDFMFTKDHSVLFSEKSGGVESGYYAAHSTNGYILDGSKKNKIKIEDLKESGGGWYEYDFGKTLYIRRVGLFVTNEPGRNTIQILPLGNSATTTRQNSTTTTEQGNVFGIRQEEKESLPYDFQVNGVCYKRNSDGKSVCVTLKKVPRNTSDVRNIFESNSNNNGESTPNYSGDVVIPSEVTYDGITYSVTSIGEKAFYECKKLTSITIPNSVTAIGNKAFFYCSGLTSVTIPNSVTTIGQGAFNCCEGLTSVTIPSSVTKLDSWAFAGCSSMTSVTIPNSLTVIRDNVFYGCYKLKSITIPNSVTKLEECAFANCSSLTSVTIPNSVTSIGKRAFDRCEGLTSVTIGNKVESIGVLAFAECESLKSIVIPNSVTTIGDWAFNKCNGLTTITIPRSVTRVEHNAFNACYNLKSVTILGTETSIGYNAFERCYHLSTVTVPKMANKLFFLPYLPNSCRVIRR